MDSLRPLDRMAGAASVAVWRAMRDFALARLVRLITDMKVQAVRDGSLAWKPRADRPLGLEAPGMPGLVAIASGIVSKAQSGDRLGNWPRLVPRWSDGQTKRTFVGSPTSRLA